MHVVGGHGAADTLAWGVHVGVCARGCEHMGVSIGCAHGCGQVQGSMYHHVNLDTHRALLACPWVCGL